MCDVAYKMQLCAPKIENMRAKMPLHVVVFFFFGHISII